MISKILNSLDTESPILIAGPTASGKSNLALTIASKLGGIIVNADSMQVLNCWKILSARPSAQDLLDVNHFMYGHIGINEPYSAGHWLRDLKKVLTTPHRPIIVGGTGLYFNALLNGLAEIPEIKDSVKEIANELELEDMVQALDDQVKAKIDLKNRARVQRAWEVQEATGESLVHWQSKTPPPLMQLGEVNTVLIDISKAELELNITKRFDQMLELGVLDEVKAMEADWDPKKIFSKAIGAPQLMSYLKKETDLRVARENSIIASRQYAKRQRTFFKKNMKEWKVYR
jgi:tRNA dimethylallyltransferase